MGLIQTHEQLRFSYLAIIEGSKRVLKPATTTINNNNNNNNETAKAVTTTKPKLTIKRSLGVNESEDATEEEIEINQATLTPLDRSDEGELDFQAKNGQLPSSPTEANNNPSLLLREERNRKTRETVEKMKRKQKETEERLRSKEKWANYLYKSSFLVLGVAICVGAYVYYKGHETMLLNFD